MMSISGLASGLDTASIISQLMQLEALPQTKLKSRVTTEQTAVTALQALNTKLATLATKAGELSTADVWGALKATSSSELVGITAASNADPANLSVTVLSTAARHQLGFATAAPLTGSQVTGATTSVELTLADGSKQLVGSGDGSLQGLVDALNASSATTGVRATAVKSTDGYRLLVEATGTGAGRGFTLTAEDGSALLGGATVQDGRDAELSLGTITTTSSTNTFTDLLPGVTVTLAPGIAAGTTAEITIAHDGVTRSEAVKGLVDQVNALLTDISTQTAYGTGSTPGGKLAGDPTVRGVARQLGEAIYPGDGTSMAPFGLEVDRYGKLTFDAATFEAAYAADPAAVEAAFAGVGGFAERVQAVAGNASDKYDGTITTSIESRTRGIDRLEDTIAAWDDRLELRRASLERTYAALEVALSNMNSQGTWLAGQIASLPTS